MIAVITLQHEGLAVGIQRKQAISVAEIPAPRTLAEVSANRSHIPDLRACCISEGHCEGRIKLAYFYASGKIVQLNETACMQSRFLVHRSMFAVQRPL